jgi:hypothetical protein
MAELCREFGISCKTGYEISIASRNAVQGLTDRSIGTPIILFRLRTIS